MIYIQLQIKPLDFSCETIDKLIEQGIYDTLDKLYQDQKEKLKDDDNKDSITKFKKRLGNYIKDLEKQNTKDLLKPVLEFKDKERL